MGVAMRKDMLHEDVLVPGQQFEELLLNEEVHFVYAKPEEHGVCFLIPFFFCFRFPHMVYNVDHVWTESVVVSPSGRSPATLSPGSGVNPLRNCHVPGVTSQRWSPSEPPAVTTRHRVTVSDHTSESRVVFVVVGNSQISLNQSLSVFRNIIAGTLVITGAEDK